MGISIERVLLSSIIGGFVRFVVGACFGGVIGASLYEATPLIWKPMDSPSFLLYIFILNLFAGFLFASIYSIFYNGIPGEGMGKGVIYGILIFLVGTLPGILALYLMMNLAPLLIGLWLIESFVSFILMGLVTALICKERRTKVERF